MSAFCHGAVGTDVLFLVARRRPVRNGSQQAGRRGAGVSRPHGEAGGRSQQATRGAVAFPAGVSDVVDMRSFNCCGVPRDV